MTIKLFITGQSFAVDDTCKGGERVVQVNMLISTKNSPSDNNRQYCIG